MNHQGWSKWLEVHIRPCYRTAFFMPIPVSASFKSPRVLLVLEGVSPACFGQCPGSPSIEDGRVQ